MLPRMVRKPRKAKRTSTPKKENADFAARLVKARDAVGISRDELAKRLKVNSSSVFRWEEGYLIPRPDVLFRLSQAVGLPADVLLFGAQSKRAAGEGARR